MSGVDGSSERDRGILSPADRDYLRGNADLRSVQSERNARARIRDRVFDATLDFELLVEHLAARERELVYGKRFDALDGADALDALVSMQAFCFQAVAETDLDFATVLREGINVAEARNERAASVDFDVTYQSLTAEQLRHKLERGESLSLTELAYLHQRDDVDMDELARYLQDADPTDEIDDGRIQSKVTNF